LIDYNEYELDEYLASVNMQGISPDRKGNILHPTSFIHNDVIMGTNNIVGPNCIISRRVIIGDCNVLLTGVNIGSPSRQRLWVDKTKPKPCKEPIINIGSKNLICEYTSIHTPMGQITNIGSNNYIGARNHISHDCKFGNNVMSAANSAYGGYCLVQDKSYIGIGCFFHPRTVVGAYSLCGSGSNIIQHVQPGAIIAGNPARIMGVNTIGLKRNGFNKHEIHEIDNYLRSGNIPLLEKTSKLVYSFSNSISNSGRKSSLITWVNNES
jgi:UDP-N-acetylglucosamine acyltransferase